MMDINELNSDKVIKPVLGLIAAALLIGVGYTVYHYVNESGELKLQSQLSVIEKKIADSEKAVALKDNPEELAPKDPKKPQEPKKPTPAVVKTPADLKTDYGTSLDELAALIQKSPTSRTAQVGALELADIYIRYKDLDAAEKALNVVPTKDPSDLLSGLVIMQKGHVLAEKNKVDEAILLWSRITEKSSVSYLHDAALLKLAFAYDSQGKKDLAIAALNKIKDSDKTKKPADAKAAESYLSQNGFDRAADKLLRSIKN